MAEPRRLLLREQRERRLETAEHEGVVDVRIRVLQQHRDAVQLALEPPHGGARPEEPLQPTDARHPSGRQLRCRSSSSSITIASTARRSSSACSGESASTWKRPSQKAGRFTARRTASPDAVVTR
jgi:hypothetical protein